MSPLTVAPISPNDPKRTSILAAKEGKSCGSKLPRCSLLIINQCALQLAGTIQPAVQPALNSSASMVASLFESTMVQSIMEGTGLPWEMAAPFGDTMVQAALHCASSKGLPFSAACATFAILFDNPRRTTFRCAPFRKQSLPTCCHNQATSARGKTSDEPSQAAPDVPIDTKGSLPTSLRCPISNALKLQQCVRSGPTRLSERAMHKDWRRPGLLGGLLMTLCPTHARPQ